MEVQVLSPAPPAQTDPHHHHSAVRSATVAFRGPCRRQTENQTVKTNVNPTGENEVELSVEIPAEAVK